MKISLTKKRLSNIALISFTDVIFLLLIFLLISSSFVTSSGIKINLPSSASKQYDYNKNTSLTMTLEKNIYINGAAVTWDGLATQLNTILVNDPEQVVLVRADERLLLKDIVQLLDTAKLSGSNRFFIATEIMDDQGLRQ